MLASEALLELCQYSGWRKTKSFVFQLEVIGFRFPYAEQQIWKSNFFIFPSAGKATTAKTVPAVGSM